MTALIDMTGMRFERLMITRQSGKKGREVLWEAKCDCGNTVIAMGTNIRNNRTQSCGCLRREWLKAQGLAGIVTHGETNSREYRAWRYAKQRCTNPKNIGWKDYGGRGITMCQAWSESYERFLADMGRCPEGLTLDRKNTDGNYEPGNCRWATPKEQANNRRRSIA